MEKMLPFTYIRIQKKKNASYRVVFVRLVMRMYILFFILIFYESQLCKIVLTQRLLIM